MGEVAKKEITKLGCEKWICRVTYCAPVGMLYRVPSSSFLTGKSNTFSTKGLCQVVLG